MTRTPPPDFVLLVCSADSNVATYRRALEGRGHPVRVRETIRSALTDLDENPSLVLVSHALPDGNGLTFAEAARRRPFVGTVVLLSASESPARIADLLDRLPPASTGPPGDRQPPASLRERLRAYERALVRDTFQALDRSPKRTAAALGIDRVTLWRKLRSYQATQDDG